MHNLVDDMVSGFAEKIAAQRDDIILSVIPEPYQIKIKANPYMPQNQVLMMLSGRALLECYPDGVEVFVWEGKPLLKLHPLHIEYKNDKLIATQRVEKL